MAVNEVYYDGKCLISLKDDTVTADDVLQGVSFHLPNGEAATGTATGGSDNLPALSNNTLTSIDFTGYDVTAIRDYLFYNNTALTSVLAPDADKVGIQSFYNTGLTQITDAEFPNLTKGNRSSFAGCKSLTKVDLSNFTSAGGYTTFQSCTALTEVNLPALTETSMTTFSGCTSLTSVNLPLLYAVGQQDFYNCTSLTDISLPCVTTLGRQAFGNCTSLKTIYFMDITSFGTTNGMFLNDTALEYIEIDNTTVPTLSTLYLFDTSTAGVLPTMTAFRGFFVPDSAVYYYRNSTNWSSLADFIHPISEL